MNVFGVHVAASAAYSKDRTSKAASDIHSDMSGTLFVSSGKCYVSKVQLERVHLHADFIAELYANWNNSENMQKLVQKYGTLYYKSATMGGVLKMATSTSKSASNSHSSQSLQTATKMSFSAKVSGYGASASGSASYSSDNSGSSDVQNSFESSSIHSSVVTYGGAPSAFGGKYVIKL